MLHALEIEALREMVKAAGADADKMEKSVIDLRLTFGENKRVIKGGLEASA